MRSYCHRTEETRLPDSDQTKGKQVSPICPAAHQDCVACHQALKAQNKPQGPVLCAMTAVSRRNWLWRG
jgi:mono/diheme cytochrome c family protein